MIPDSVWHLFANTVGYASNASHVIPSSNVCQSTDNAPRLTSKRRLETLMMIHRKRRRKHVPSVTDVANESVNDQLIEVANEDGYRMIEQYKDVEKHCGTETRVNAIVQACDSWMLHMRMSRKYLYESTYHNCHHRTCEFDRLTVNVWECNTQFERLSNEYPRIHTCYYNHTTRKNYCSEPHNSHVHVKKRWFTDQVFICRSTGKVHECGKHCDSRSGNLSADGLYTCSITGQANDNDRKSESEKIATARLPDAHNNTNRTTPTNSRDRVKLNQAIEMMVEPSEFHNRHNITGDILHDFMQKIYDQKTMGSMCEILIEALDRFGSNYREIYQVFAFGMIRMLVSTERIDLHERLCIGAKTRADSEVRTFVNFHHTPCRKVPTNYRARLFNAKHKHSLDAMAITNQWYYQYYKSAPQNDLPTDVSMAFCVEVATDVVKIWHALKSTIYSGTAIPFIEFVLPGLELLAGGVHLRSDSLHIVDVEVIKPRNALSLILPSNLDEIRFFRQYFENRSSLIASKIRYEICNHLAEKSSTLLFNIDRMDLSMLDINVFESISNIRPKLVEMHTNITTRAERACTTARFV